MAGIIIPALITQPFSGCSFDYSLESADGLSDADYQHIEHRAPARPTSAPTIDFGMRDYLRLGKRLRRQPRLSLLVSYVMAPLMNAGPT